MQDRTLLLHIRTLFTQHHGRYGSPRIHHALQARGMVMNRRRVARLMRADGLRARAVLGYRAKAGAHRFFAAHPRVDVAAPPRWERDTQRPRGRQSARTSGPGDNAHMESFCHSMKAEAARGRRFATDAELHATRRDYMRDCSTARAHSALDYRSPIDFERRAA